MAERGERLQVAAIAALVLNGICVLLFLAGTLVPSAFPHVMRHPPVWWWPTALGAMLLLFLVSRLRR